TFAVRFVDHENVGDLHDSGLNGLHIVAHAGNEHDHGNVGQRHDVHFILAHPDGFNHDEVAPAGVEHGGDIGGGAGKSAERAARGHAANVDSRVGVVRLHADAVAENRASAERAGGIDRHDADGLVLLAVLARDLI